MKTIGIPVEAEIAGVFRVAVFLPYSDTTLEVSYIENVIYTDWDTILFVCGISSISVILFFAGIGSLEPKKLLM